MLENDELNEVPPHESYLSNEKRLNTVINQQTYQIINEKKNNLQRLKHERDALIVDFNENNQSSFIKHELVNSIITKKLNISLLKNELANSQHKIKNYEESIELLNKRVARRKQILLLYQDKIEKCKHMIKKSESMSQNKINNEKEGLNALKLNILELAKQRIDELNKFVFDVSEIKTSKEDDLLQKSTRIALKDARQTVYVNGRWILSNDHVNYRIVGSMLPSNCDYASYLSDKLKKDDKLDDDESSQLDNIDRQYQNQFNLKTRAVNGQLANNMNNFPNNSYNINKNAINLNGSNNVLCSSSSAASNLTSTYNAFMESRSIDRLTILSGLTYTVQFVNLIAFYLNILLPYNLPLSKFCLNQLNDKQFQNAVAKLNTNIVYLSINQHIPVTNLLPKHTLENLNHFLTYFREMRIKVRERHSIVFPSHMIPLLEEMFTDCEDECLQDSAIPNLIFNENEEWETVPNSNEIPSDDTVNSSIPRTVSTSLISSVLSQFWFKNNTNSK